LMRLPHTLVVNFRVVFIAYLFQLEKEAILSVATGLARQVG